MASLVPLGHTLKDNVGGTAPDKCQAHSDVAGVKVTLKASETGMPPNGHYTRQGPEVKRP